LLQSAAAHRGDSQRQNAARHAHCKRLGRPGLASQHFTYKHCLQISGVRMRTFVICETDFLLSNWRIHFAASPFWRPVTWVYKYLCASQKESNYFG